MKHTRNIFLSLLISFSFSLSAFADFSDIEVDHINAEAINYVQSEGIVSGYEDGTFRPEQNINRAEFTKIIIATQFDSEAIENCTLENVDAEWTYVFFSDVRREDWFAPFVCLAKINEIIGGYTDGTFGGEKEISFVEASKIISLSFGLEAEIDTEVWYRPFVDQLSEKNAIPTTISELNQLITRGEMAEIIYRLKADINTKESKTYDQLAGIPFPELSQVCGGITITEEEKIILSESADIIWTLLPEDGASANILQEKIGEEICIFFDKNEFVEDRENFILHVTSASFIKNNDDSNEALQIEINAEIPTETPEEDVETSAKQFEITAQKWEFIPDVITVKKGDTVRLSITSVDVEHGFAITSFDINELITPLQTIQVEFIATESGEFPFFSSVFSGTGSQKMKGKIIVTE